MAHSVQRPIATCLKMKYRLQQTRLELLYTSFTSLQKVVIYSLTVKLRSKIIDFG